MTLITRMAAALAAGAALSTSAFAERAAGAPAPSTFLPVENEPPPRLIVGPPAAEPLTRGVAVIPYRTENFRILPVFGAGAVKVSPRAGHLHVTLDDLPWHWVDASDAHTIVVAGLAPGPHTVRIELADPVHRVLAAETAAFTVPTPALRPR